MRRLNAPQIPERSRAITSATVVALLLDALAIPPLEWRGPEKSPHAQADDRDPPQQNNENCRLSVVPSLVRPFLRTRSCSSSRMIMAGASCAVGANFPGKKPRGFQHRLTP